MIPSGKMWFSKLSVKLFLVYAALNFGLAVAYVSLVAGWQKRLIEQQIELRLRDTALALQDQVLELVAAGRNDRLQRVAVDLSQAAGMRITIVGPAGAVLADSDEDPTSMQNHLDRPEFQEAAQRGVGTAVRLSTTVRRRMSYLALRLNRDGQTAAFVRVALPLESIDAQANALHRYLWISASVVGAIALVLTYLIAGRIMRPLYRLTDAAEAVAAGDYQQRIPVGTARRSRNVGAGRRPHAAGVDSASGRIARELAAFGDGLEQHVGRRAGSECRPARAVRQRCQPFAAGHRDAGGERAALAGGDSESRRARGGRGGIPAGRTLRIRVRGQRPDSPLPGRPRDSFAGRAVSRVSSWCCTTSPTFAAWRTSAGSSWRTSLTN